MDQLRLLFRFLLSLPPTLLLILFIVSTFVVISIIYSFLSSFVTLLGLYLRSTDPNRRKNALATLGIVERGKEGEERKKIVGFFHPYCNAGGGGERVLWAAVSYLQRTEGEDLICAIYTGDMLSTTKEAMIEKVKARFGITLNPKSLLFVSLRTRYLVEDTTWTRFTLLGQSAGSMFLALEGVKDGLIPDIWIDTMGYAFAYPLIRSLCRIPIGSYTHYPTISTDMLKRVANRKQGITNRGFIASSVVLTQFKLLYYRVFAYTYSRCLRKADVLMVNSTWTKRHVDRLLRPFHWDNDDDDDVDVDPASKLIPNSLEPLDGTLRNRLSTPSTPDANTTALHPPLVRYSKIVYPPCDTIAFSSLPLTRSGNIILSVAQFRPEKEHSTQLRALKLFFDKHPERQSGDLSQRVELIMAGSVRGKEDEARVEILRNLAKELKIEDSVRFEINVPYPALIALFGSASIGLHTMIDEHFGITVVEIQAAGLIPLVHASAGPLLDIVVPFESKATGYHATSADSFAAQLSIIFEMTEEEIGEMRERARRNAVERFSTEGFERGWEEGWSQLKNVKIV